MTWKDHLTRQEAAELSRAERKREEAREAYNAVRRKLKARCDSRIRRGKEAEDG